jgi:hypothetical protein
MVIGDNLYDNSDCGAFLSPGKSSRLGERHGSIAKVDHFRRCNLRCWWRGLVYFFSSLIGRYQQVKGQRRLVVIEANRSCVLGRLPMSDPAQALLEAPSAQ